MIKLNIQTDAREPRFFKKALADILATYQVVADFNKHGPDAVISICYTTDYYQVNDRTTPKRLNRTMYICNRWNRHNPSRWISVWIKMTMLHEILECIGLDHKSMAYLGPEYSYACKGGYNQKNRTQSYGYGKMKKNRI